MKKENQYSHHHIKGKVSCNTFSFCSWVWIHCATLHYHADTLDGAKPAYLSLMVLLPIQCLTPECEQKFLLLVPKVILW